MGFTTDPSPEYRRLKAESDALWERLLTSPAPQGEERRRLQEKLCALLVGLRKASASPDVRRSGDLRPYIFTRKSRWRNAKLEDWPLYLILIWLGISSFLGYGVGAVLKTGTDLVSQHMQQINSLQAAGTLAGQFLLLAAIALLFLSFATFAVRLTKVLSERWFP
jgi:hypothetical protein